MEQFSKQEWIHYIGKILLDNEPFQYKTTSQNNLFILFAADSFRRNGHEVLVDIAPTELHVSCITISIFPNKTCIEFTLRYNDKPSDIIQQIIDSKCTTVSLRGCGTVVQSILKILDYVLHSGWYIDNTIMSTLTQQKETTKQRNTALHVVVKKG